jgi:hypothetical protein
MGAVLVERCFKLKSQRQLSEGLGVFCLLDRNLLTPSGESSHIFSVTKSVDSYLSTSSGNKYMDISDRQMRRMLWEAKAIFDDPHHPINDRRHPKHHQAVVARRLIEEQGRRLLGARTRESG